jgi:hypothetical protein
MPGFRIYLASTVHIKVLIPNWVDLVAARKPPQKKDTEEDEKNLSSIFANISLPAGSLIHIAGPSPHRI